MYPPREDMRSAASAGTEELWQLLKGQQPAVISQAVFNGHFNEQMAIFTAKCKRTPQDVLEILANDGRFRSSYELKLAICKNPRAARKTTFSLLKFVKIFDLAEISKDPFVNINVRQKIEYLISERIPSMPVGIMIALAKKAGPNIVFSLFQSGHQAVISACLENPLLTEGHIYKLINKGSTSPTVIRMISEHKKWSLRYHVRFALIRNFYTPMPLVVKFIRSMNISDLKDLHSDPGLPLSTRPFIYRELLERGDIAEDRHEIYRLEDDGDSIPGEKPEK